MPIISPRARLLSATALACGSISVGATAARAACAPDPPGGAPVVKCAGTDDNGFAAPPADDLFVNVTGIVRGTPPISFDGNSAQKALDNTGIIEGTITALGNTGNVAINQRGTVNGGVTITGSGTTVLTLDRGRTFNGRVSMAGRLEHDHSSGTFNNGLVLTGIEFNDVVNRAGAQINQTFSLSGDGQNQLDNYGIVNNGLTIDGDGTSVVFNRANATINGDLESVGTSSDYVDNFGRFNNRIIQGDGADVTINRPGGTINGQVSQGGAQDWFQMLGGLLNQDVQQGDGPDDAWINGGLINGGVGTGTGEDHLLWDGGNIRGFGIDMGDDDDVAVFRELTPDNLTSGLKIDGGLGDDELFWQTTTGADVSRFCGGRPSISPTARN